MELWRMEPGSFAVYLTEKETIKQADKSSDFKRMAEYQKADKIKAVQFRIKAEDEREARQKTRGLT
ncbi:hypothetical protein ACKXGF_07750 [Alkalibacillus sp. S2W]|uniref:hypothetical protein n=1 Tax=Alkalibacillus sp. S2W TaxID=3386553 RepID=UPI00398D0DC2